MPKIIILIATLITIIVLPITACGGTSATETTSSTTTSAPTTTEVEATEYSGVKLTPMNLQGNNALDGTQYIDRDTYSLTIDGLVNHPLTLTYDQLAAYPQVSRLGTLDCVDGWNFTAKWTGPTLNSILADAGVKPGAQILIFYTTDVPEGYTSLELSYVQFHDIILAMKLNDITLPQDRGFPFQVVADWKFGYKWAKWVTRIEVSDDTNFRGYWESQDWDHIGDVTGPKI